MDDEVVETYTKRRTAPTMAICAALFLRDQLRGFSGSSGPSQSTVIVSCCDGEECTDAFSASSGGGMSPSKRPDSARLALSDIVKVYEGSLG